MYNFGISLAIGLVLTFGIGAFFGGWWYGIIPGVIAFGIAYVILARRTMNQVQSIVTRAQKQMQSRNIDRGIEILEDAFSLSKWQFFVEAQIHAQIGSVLYMDQRFDEAEPHLKKAFKKNWVARAMLGTLYYKRKKFDEMQEVFDEAVKANKKESLLWNLYAYCMWKSGQKDEAIDVLNRGVDKLDGEDRTEKNLDRLKNGRSMKMRNWGHQWYQFHLDSPPAQRQQQPQFRRM